MLYTSLERDGAIAEVYAMLRLQPVFPSVEFQVHQLNVSVNQVLNLSDLAMLADLGLPSERYREREYGKAQEIADAAYFLGFEGLIVPNARWSCSNLVLFTDRIEPGCLTVDESTSESVDWGDWHRRNRSGRE